MPQRTLYSAQFSSSPLIHTAVNVTAKGTNSSERLTGEAFLWEMRLARQQNSAASEERVRGITRGRRNPDKRPLTRTSTLGQPQNGPRQVLLVPPVSARPQ